MQNAFITGQKAPVEVRTHGAAIHNLSSRPPSAQGQPMQRREFLHTTATLAGAALAGCTVFRNPRGRPTVLNAAAFHAERRFQDTQFGRIAYVERGSGPAALFIHGYPLNGFQWRGAMERLSSLRRCLAPDLLGLGYSVVPEDQDLAPRTQAEMLLALLDAVSIESVDLVANDSGLTIAQLIVARQPTRVRSLLLTNGDVHENSPPALLRPFIEKARAGLGAEEWLLPQYLDHAIARSPRGLGGSAYTNPANFTDELIECYFAPLLATPLRKAQFNRYAVAFDPNPLLAIEADLRKCAAPARIVWGTGDELFPIASAEWLDRTLPRSRGIRRIEGAHLFFPEEFPDLIAEEARMLWARS